MKLAVLLLLAACSCHSQHMQDVAPPHHNKVGAGDQSTVVVDKQVEYVTGPNVGIVGPTVLGGQGQEIQPSNDEDESRGKAERDVSGQGGVHSEYQELPVHQSELKGQSMNDADSAKYNAPLTNYGASRGRIKYGQNNEGLHSQYNRDHILNDDKNRQFAEQNNDELQSSTPKVTGSFYHSDGQAYPQSVQQEHNFYNSQNVDEQALVQLQAHVSAGNAGRLLNEMSEHGVQYQHVASQIQVQGQGGSVMDKGQSSKSEGSSSPTAPSENSGSQMPPQDNSHLEGAQGTPPNEAQVYIQPEYVQYQLNGGKTHLSNLQPTLHYPGKHQLQILIPEGGTSGPAEVHPNNAQLAAALHGNSHLQSILNGHQQNFSPIFRGFESPSVMQNEHQSHQLSPNYLRPISQLVSQVSHTRRPSISTIKEPQISIHPQAAHASSIPPSTYRPHVLQSHPQLQTAFQPSPHQLNLNIQNERTQYYLLQHSNDAVIRPQTHHLQIPKPSPHPDPQYAQVHKPDTRPSLNLFNKLSSGTPNGGYRQQVPEHISQRPAEHPTLNKQVPQKSAVHSQHSDRSPHQPIQSGQLYHQFLALSSDKSGPSQQSHPFNVHKTHTTPDTHSPIHFPVKAFSFEPQVHVPLTSSYQESRDKTADYNLRPILHPIATPAEQPVQVEVSQQPEQPFIDPAKFFDGKSQEPVKISSFINSLGRHAPDQSKPFGFSQTTFGQKPGSYSYSIFNKHS